MNKIKIRNGYYPNGQIKFEIHELNGNCHGLVKEWWPNGNLRYSIFRIGIQRYGICEMHCQDGIRGSIECFKIGNRNGPQMSFIYYEPNDVEI